jgi:hypothetical protein
MQTASTAQSSHADGDTRRSGRASILISTLGIIVVPMAIVFAANSYSAPEASDYVRMALASVAAAVLALASASALLVVDRVEFGRFRLRTIVVCLVVVSQALSTITEAHDRLVTLIG